MTRTNHIQVAMAALLISLFWRIQPGNAQTQTGEQPLLPGTVIEREIVKDKSHRYSIYLSARQSLRVAATQKYGQQYQTDLILTALNPNGTALTEVNLYSRDEGAETMTIVAETDGVYVVVLSLSDKGSSPGAYQLQTTQPRPATAEDEERMKAQNAFQTANKLRQTPNRENKLKAIELAENALRSWQTLGEALWEGESLNLIGMTLRDLSRQNEAIAYFTRAVPLIEKSGARFARAAAAHNICQAYYDLALYADCLTCKQSALKQFRELEETGYAQAVQDSLGPVYAMLGERDLALKYFNMALAYVRSKGLTRSEARTLSNFGVFHIMMNEYQQALDYYEQSLAVHRKSDFPHEAAGVNFNLGALYYRLNDDAKAAEYYQESLKLYRQTGNATGICAALNGLALIEAGAGNYPKMLEHLAEGLSLARKSQLIVEEAMALIYHNWAYVPLKEWNKAREALQQGLALCRKTDNRQCEILALGQLGQVMLELKELAEAKTHFDQLRQISHLRHSVSGESIALSGLASIALEENRLSEALQLSGQSLELIESTRGKIFKSDLRASFFAAQQSSYQKQVEILLRLHEQNPSSGYAGQALSVNERARARNLLETLTAGATTLPNIIAPELLAEEKKLRLQLSQYEQARLSALSKKETATQAATLEKEVGRLLSKYETVQVKIRQTNPHYAALAQPQPLTAEQIQKLLDEDTLLLEYALGEKRSVLWAVTSDATVSISLPPAKQIEAAAIKCYDLIKESKQRRWQRDAELSALELSRMILPSVSSLSKQLNLSSKKRLVIVADGVLQFIPFNLLSLPTETAATRSTLLSRFELINLPSASTLAALRNERSEQQKPSKLLAIFSDPVFEPSDPRLKASLATNAPPGTPSKSSLASRQLTRSAEEAGLNTFTRLPFSRREATAILALADNAHSKNNLDAFDFTASRNTALNANLGNYRILHFATHGLLNSRHPELSGIALSLINEMGQPQDGFLRMTDLYNLKLNADLVVLSACRTAMGKDIKGEGLIGLTRGFMYAGAPRIVASLWDVNDAATAELMSRFYRHLLKDKLPAATALRAAQLSMSKEARWAAPYYWAGFVIQGDWQQSK